MVSVNGIWLKNIRMHQVCCWCLPRVARLMVLQQ